MKREKFETAVQKDGLRPLGRFNTPEGAILVAEGFKNDNMLEFPLGYYKLVWAIERDGLDFGHSLMFEALHDPDIAFADKPRARLNAALKDASGWLAVNKQTGRYDA